MASGCVSHEHAQVTKPGVHCGQGRDTALLIIDAHTYSKIPTRSTMSMTVLLLGLMLHALSSHVTVGVNEAYVFFWPVAVVVACAHIQNST